MGDTFLKVNYFMNEATQKKSTHKYGVNLCVAYENYQINILESI